MPTLTKTHKNPRSPVLPQLAPLLPSPAAGVADGLSQARSFQLSIRFLAMHMQTLAQNHSCCCGCYSSTQQLQHTASTDSRRQCSAAGVFGCCCVIVVSCRCLLALLLLLQESNNVLLQGVIGVGFLLGAVGVGAGDKRQAAEENKGTSKCRGNKKVRNVQTAGTCMLAAKCVLSPHPCHRSLGHTQTFNPLPRVE